MMTYKLTTELRQAKVFASQDAAESSIISGSNAKVMTNHITKTHVLMVRGHYVKAIEML